MKPTTALGLDDKKGSSYCDCNECRREGDYYTETRVPAHLPMTNGVPMMAGTVNPTPIRQASQV